MSDHGRPTPLRMHAAWASGQASVRYFLSPTCWPYGGIGYEIQILTLSQAHNEDGYWVVPRTV